MSERRFFVLVHERARAGAMRAVHEAPDGFVVKIEPPAKSREQENKYHAMIDRIARRWRFLGRKWDRESMKRLLVDMFAEEMRLAGKPLHNDQQSEIVPSIDGKRLVQLGIQTRDFYVSEGSAFIEFLYAIGAEHGVEWSDEVTA